MKKSWNHQLIKLCAAFLFSTFLAFLVPVSSVCAQTVEAFTTDHEEIRSLCQDGNGGFYLLTSEALYQWSSGAEPQPAQRIHENNMNLMTFLAYGEGWVGISEDFALYVYDGKNFSNNGMIEGNSPEWRGIVEGQAYITQVVSEGESLFFIVRDDALRSSYCLRITPAEKSSTVVFDDKPIACTAWKDGKILIYQRDKDMLPHLWSYDLATQEALPVAISALPNRLQAMHYDPQKGVLYIAAVEGLMASEGMQSFAPIFPLQQATAIAVVQGNAIAAAMYNKVYVFDLTAPQEENSLCVMGLPSGYEHEFMTETGIVIEPLNAYGETDMERITVAMSTQDSTIDVVGLYTHEGLGQLKKKGMYFDLYNSQTLRLMSGELYPILARAFTEGEDLVAWPTAVMPMMRFYEPELLLEYGIPFPDTFDDLLDILPLILESNILSENSLRLFDTVRYDQEGLLIFFLKQYLFTSQLNGQRVDFDNETFRRIVGRILNETPRTDPLPMPTGDEAPLLTMLGVTIPISEHSISPLQIDAGFPAGIETWAYVYVVNPYSKKIPQALQYLEYLSQIKDESSYTYYASMNQPYESPYALAEMEKAQEALQFLREEKPASMTELEQRTEMEALTQELAQLEKQRYWVTPEAVANYRIFAQSLVVLDDQMIQLDDGLSNYTKQLVAGRYDIESYIAACNQYVQRIYGERDMPTK